MIRRWLITFSVIAVFFVPGASAQTSCTLVMGGQVCQVTAATVTMSTSSNVTYAWDSTTVSSRTQGIGFYCGGTTTPFVANGFSFTVKDEVGTAGTTLISVTPFGGTETIDMNARAFVLNANFESITFQCDGNHNWIVE